MGTDRGHAGYTAMSWNSISNLASLREGEEGAPAYLNYDIAVKKWRRNSCIPSFCDKSLRECRNFGSKALRLIDRTRSNTLPFGAFVPLPSDWQAVPGLV